MVKGNVIDKATGVEKFSLRGASRDKIEAMIDSETEVIIYTDNLPIIDIPITVLDQDRLVKIRNKLAEKEEDDRIKSNLSVTSLTISEVSNWVDANVKTQADILDILKQLIILNIKN